MHRLPYCFLFTCNSWQNWEYGNRQVTFSSVKVPSFNLLLLPEPHHLGNTQNLYLGWGFISTAWPHTLESVCSCSSKSIGGAKAVTTSLVPWIFCNFLVWLVFKCKGSVKRGRLFSRPPPRDHYEVTCAKVSKISCGTKCTCNSMPLIFTKKQTGESKLAEALLFGCSEGWKKHKSQRLLQWRTPGMSSFFSLFMLVSALQKLFCCVVISLGLTNMWCERAKEN